MGERKKESLLGRVLSANLSHLSDSDSKLVAATAVVVVVVRLYSTQQLQIDPKSCQLGTASWREI